MELNQLCKHEKGQKQPGSHSSSELSKTQFFTVGIVNTILGTHTPFDSVY